MCTNIYFLLVCTHLLGKKYSFLRQIFHILIKFDSFRQNSTDKLDMILSVWWQITLEMCTNEPILMICTHFKRFTNSTATNLISLLLKSKALKERLNIRNDFLRHIFRHFFNKLSISADDIQTFYMFA